MLPELMIFSIFKEYVPVSVVCHVFFKGNYLKGLKVIPMLSYFVSRNIFLNAVTKNKLKCRWVKPPKEIDIWQ